jgi:hypothetical protein
MVSPSVMFIEMGAGSLSNVSEFIAKSQQIALHSFGDERARAIGASGVSYDFQRGYELGLATARALLLGNVTLAAAGINPKDIL